MNTNTHRARTHRARRGFTLVEMLIVIGIIALLAAILLPVMSRVRESGRRTACASNMKQLGMAFMQYANDSNQRLPNAVDGNWGVGKTGGWTYYDGPKAATGLRDKSTSQFNPTKGSLFSYVRSAGIYVCPSDGEANGNEGSPTKQSYAANACVFSKASRCPGGTGKDGDCREGKSLTRFRSPTEWMLLGEESREDLADSPTSTDDAYLNLRNQVATGADAEADIYENYFSGRHSGGSVITFMDGHSKWYTRDAIKSSRFQIGGPSIDAAKTLDQGCPAGVQ